VLRKKDTVQGKENVDNAEDVECVEENEFGEVVAAIYTSAISSGRRRDSSSSSGDSSAAHPSLSLTISPARARHHYSKSRWTHGMRSNARRIVSFIITLSLPKTMGGKGAFWMMK